MCWCRQRDREPLIKLIKCLLLNFLPGPRREPGQRIIPAENNLQSEDNLPAEDNLIAEDNLPAEDNLQSGDNLPAEDKLLSVRSQFIYRVSEPVLDQLLDKLLQCGIVSDEEMQSLRSKNKIDRARDTIDIVRRKGPDASLILIAALCKGDPCLSRALKLSWSVKNPSYRLSSDWSPFIFILLCTITILSF